MIPVVERILRCCEFLNRRMQTLTLAATTRTVLGKAVKLIRQAGRIPAVVYGHGVTPLHVEIDARAFEKVFHMAGESTLVDVAVDAAAPLKTLIQDVQRDPYSDRVIHVDLRSVNMKEKVTAEVRLSYQGESPAEKAVGAVLTRVREHVDVECLPGDLVSELVVDLGMLKNVGDMIRVRDLNVPTAVTILADADDVLVTASAALTEEQIKAMEQQSVGDVSAIEVVEKKKTEESEEGAADAEKTA